MRTLLFAAAFATLLGALPARAEGAGGEAAAQTESTALAEAEGAKGEAASEPAPAAGQPKQARYFEGMGSTPEEQALYEELSGALSTYESESKDFRREVQLLIEKKYEARRGELTRSYEQAIRDLEVRERKERLDAIAQFEEFLRRYPNDERYTPEVMFRLAELYYERTSDDHMLAMRDFAEGLRAIENDPEAMPPPEPAPDFNPSIALYRRILEQFPKFEHSDASWYLLGYCLEKQNDFDQGLLAYQELIARHPRSKFTTEAWVRIGEHWFDAFDVPDALQRAAAAYEQAIFDRKHALYDKALYKLGWVYYRMDRFDDAVDRFVLLADHYEEKARLAGEEEVGGDLREEALQYTAISFADDNWGSMAKAQAYFAAKGGRPYEFEIYRRIGDVYFDQTRHDDAIAAYRLVLEKNPLAKDAPQVQQKIVQAYERDRKLAESFREADRLGKMFAPGTPWHERHRRDPEAMAMAEELAETNLYRSAIFHHQQAVRLRDEGNAAQAQEAFELAASSYRAYVSRFPRSKNAYEIQFYLAESLYNSKQFGEAAGHYEAVRDSTADDRYLEDAAFAAVLSRQQQLELDVSAGTVAPVKVLRSADRPEGQAVAKTPLHEAEAALVATSDAWLKRYPEHERSPGIAYKAAELFYAHDDFEEARRRFELIVQTWPKHEVAQFSTNLIVESFLVTKDWASVEEVAARLAENTAVIDPKSDLYKDLVKFKLAGRFKLADERMANGDFEGAAKKYIELVDEEPRHEFADKALNNAAVAYESARRFDSALRLYERIFNEYPKSTLADQALFRVAVNAENSYDFDKAVGRYQQLVRDYPASKNRESALFNTARLLEGQQRYDEAARAFIRYVELFPDADDAPRNQFRAALIYEKQQDWRRYIQALEAFTRKFSKDDAQVDLVVDARRRIGEAHQKLGAHAEAKRAWEAAAQEFDRRGLSAETHALAANAAAYARFQLAEYVFRDFEKLKIGGRGKALERSFVDKKEAVVKVNDAYAQVFPYKQLEWTLAALFRRGFALERFAQTILETPVPPEVKRGGEEAVIVYQDMLAQQTVALEEAAVQSYEATLAEARKNRIANEWTRRTLESLNRFRPREYPVLKEPKPAFASESVYPEGVVADVFGRALEAPAAQKLGGDEK